MKLQNLVKTALFTGLATFALSATAGVFPDLPVAVKNGGGAVVGDQLFVGLGSAGQKVFKVNLKDPAKGWQEVQSFPGAARDQALVAAVNGKVYVFGGHGKNEKGVLEVFADGYVYDPVANTWEQLYQRSPLGSTGASVVSYQDKLWVVGGVDPLIFNGYFTDATRAGDNADLKKELNRLYFDKPAKDYFFNDKLYSFDPKTNQWSNEGVIPNYLGRAGAGFAVKDGVFTVVNGEVKPGLRTDKVEVGMLKDGKVTWQHGQDLIGPAAGVEQEGLAAPFAGYQGDLLVVAGGANFPGAAKAYRGGKNYAHEGFKKTWQKGVYALKDGKWSFVGELPYGAAAGVTVSLGDKLLFVGGETDGGKALTSVLEVQVKDGKLEVK